MFKFFNIVKVLGRLGNAKMTTEIFFITFSKIARNHSLTYKLKSIPDAIVVRRRRENCVLLLPRRKHIKTFTASCSTPKITFIVMNLIVSFPIDL